MAYGTRYNTYHNKKEYQKENNNFQFNKQFFFVKRAPIVRYSDVTKTKILTMYARMHQFLLICKTKLFLWEKKYLLVLFWIIIFLNIPIVYCDNVTLIFAPANLTGTQHDEMNEVLLISLDLEVSNIEDFNRWEFEFDYDEGILELW
jgi:hypothetical protein